MEIPHKQTQTLLKHATANFHRIHSPNTTHTQTHTRQQTNKKQTRQHQQKKRKQVKQQTNKKQIQQNKLRNNVK